MAKNGENKSDGDRFWKSVQRALLVLALLGVPSVGGLIWNAAILASDVEKATKTNDQQDVILQQQTKLTERLIQGREDDKELLKLIILQGNSSHAPPGATPADPVQAQLALLIDKLDDLANEIKELRAENVALKAENEQLKNGHP